LCFCIFHTISLVFDLSIFSYPPMQGCDLSQDQLLIFEILFPSVWDVIRVRVFTNKNLSRLKLNHKGSILECEEITKIIFHHFKHKRLKPINFVLI
jgi:hypothetical protein